MSCNCSTSSALHKGTRLVERLPRGLRQDVVHVVADAQQLLGLTVDVRRLQTSRGANQSDGEFQNPSKKQLLGLPVDVRCLYCKIEGDHGQQATGVQHSNSSLVRTRSQLP